MQPPKVNIIFDSRQHQDYGRLLGEFITQEITDYKFWNAIIYPESVIKSINASHKMIVRDAKEKGLKELCIAEQDLMFTSPDGWQHFLNRKPENFDLYLWGSYVVPLSNKKVCGFQLYIISEKFYDKFLSVSDDVHIDTCMDSLEGEYIFCYPFSALQKEGYSANNKAQVNYNAILRKEDIYK